MEEKSPARAAVASCCSIVNEPKQDAVTKALEDRGLKRMNFRFDQQGATVILNVANFDQSWVEPYD